MIRAGGWGVFFMGYRAGGGGDILCGKGIFLCGVWSGDEVFLYGV